MPFAEPESSNRLNPRDIIGNLLLVWPTDHVASVPTRYGTSDAIVVDVVNLDEPDPRTMQPGTLYQGVWWLPSKLIASLKRRVGTPDPILARMGHGSANPGMNAPFVLISATQDADAVRRAEAWLNANPGFKPTPPAIKLEMVEEQAAENEPQPEPPAEPQASRVQSDLERLARISREGADRLPPPPRERFPY